MSGRWWRGLPPIVVAVLTVALAVPAAGSVGPFLAAGQNCEGPPVTVDPAVPWPQVQLAPQRVWSLTRGAGVTVAVVDSGVDAQSPQLAGRVLPGTDVINAGGGAADTDCYGHGTFVAGIIAAAPAAGTGFAGVAPDATILPVRAANSANDGSTDAMANGIRSAVDAGASVINVSASTTVPNADLVAAVDYAGKRNVVVVAAAANQAQSGDPVPYPAAYPSVLAVGAINSAGQRSSFSETGSYLGLVAPGENVVSIGPGGAGQWQGSGTSYAAPFVAGVAALVRAYHPGLTAAQVRHRLLVTADHPGKAMPDSGLGWGTVNPMAAVSTVLPEEAAAGNAVTIPPAVHHPVLPVADHLGGEITILGVLGLIGVVCLSWFGSALWSRGNRRRWRRARMVRVASSGTTTATKRRPPAPGASELSV